MHNYSAASFPGGTHFGYDAMGNKISQVLPDGEKQTWLYDAYGNLILHQVFGAANGQTNTTASSTTWDIYDTSDDGHGGRMMAEYRYTGDFEPTGAGKR